MSISTISQGARFNQKVTDSNGTSALSADSPGENFSERGFVVQTTRRTSIIDAARKLVAKEILAEMGGDIPCAPRFKKYLERQTLSDLVARRHQLREENQLKLKL